MPKYGETSRRSGDAIRQVALRSKFSFCKSALGFLWVRVGWVRVGLGGVGCLA